MKLKNATFLSALAGALTAAAIPEITAVSMTQDRNTCEVTIGYTLSGAPAIVTVDILTNGVPVGGSLLAGRVSGAVNRVVEPSSYELKWNPRGIPGVPEARRWCDDAVARVTAWPTNAPPTYLIVDLNDGSLEFRPDLTWFSEPGGITNRIFKTDKLVLRKIAVANEVHRIGSPNPVGNSNLGEYGRRGDGNTPCEKPLSVMLTDDYYIGVFEVTQGQWKHLSGRTVKCGQGGVQSITNDVCPIANVRVKQELRGQGSNNDDYRAHYFWPRCGHGVQSTSVMGQLRALVGQAVEFDLPTDAQWEIAARAGCPFAYYDGTRAYDESEAIDALCWSGYNSDGTVHEVGLKKPNDWGLYDMLGNALEPVLDLVTHGNTNDYHNAASLQIDPKGPPYAYNMAYAETGGEYCVSRGGSFKTTKENTSAGPRADLRVARRTSCIRWASSVENGFRVAAPACIR